MAPTLVVRCFVASAILIFITFTVWKELYHYAANISPKVKVVHHVFVPVKVTTNEPKSERSKIPYSVYRDGFAEGIKALKNDKNTIPKIIHQTWKDYEVPAQFVTFIKTWLEKHPDWEYWLWTDKDAENIIKLRHPTFYKQYMQYSYNMQRADAMRYVVLYEFGGWYSDLDVRVLRSLDDISKKHHCVIPLEPWGQAIVTWNRVRLASNAILAAIPRHPFFKRVIDTLPSLAGRRGPSAALWSTGPFVIDDIITKYESEAKKNTSGFFPNETVWLANPEHFLPIADASAVLQWRGVCKRVKRSNKLQTDYCGYLRKTNYANELPKDSYTTHAWSHTYFGYGNKKMNIFKAVPSAINVSEILQQLKT